MAEVRRDKPRERERETLAAEWEARRRERSAAGSAPVETRGADVKAYLQRAWEATNDPALHDALLALAAWGLDAGKPTAALKAATERAYGDTRRAWARRVAEWLDLNAVEVGHPNRPPLGNASVRRASERVALDLAVEAPCFDTAAGYVEAAYATFEREGCPQHSRDPLDGGFPFDVHAVPRPGCSLTIAGTGHPLPAEGLVVPYTAAARRAWRDGEVSLRRVARGDRRGATSLPPDYGSGTP